MAPTLLTLISGPLELEICPAVGGAIASFRFAVGEQRRPILRESPEPLDSVLDAANFPLVPFVNRVRGGAFVFRGRTVHLTPNMAGDPSPLHGQGWLGDWQVERADDAGASLSFHHDAAEWPWDYRAEQTFALDQDGLSIGLSCRNLSDLPMPCGLGQHPYFPCTAQTLIDTAVEHVWTIDENVLPVEKVAAIGRFDLRQRRICGQDLDHGFGGWNGRADIRDPGWPFTVAVTSPTARFFQIYSPESGGIFVAEPVSHANAALNAPEEEWAGLGMQILEPGEEMRLDMRTDVRPT